MANVLDVVDLRVGFGTLDVLHALTFHVEKGSAVAIVGPNGAGKTVLFRALIGSIPHRGLIRWSPGTRTGYVPQKLDLERDLPITARDLISAKNEVTKAGENVTESLARVGLGEAENKPIGALSGGQFQRLLVALALIGRPNVLLLDEPTSGVDESGQENLNEIVRRFQKVQGMTVLLISHDLSVVYRYANSVLCLSREKSWFGPPREIMTPVLLQELYGTPVEYHVHGD